MSLWQMYLPRPALNSPLRPMTARLARNRHRLLGWAWILLAIPSVLWWKDSIIWVILLSLYANAEASFAAHHAKKENR